MEIIAVVSIGIIATALAVVLKQYKPEFSMLVSLGACILLLLLLLKNIVPVLDKITDLLTVTAANSNFTSILLKTVAICFITQLGVDTCKDAGEVAIASKVEMVGKILVLIAALPLYEEILSIVNMLIYGTGM